MKKYQKRDDFLDCVDKRKMNHSVYHTNIFALNIEFFTYEDAGFIKEWSLYSIKHGLYGGEDVTSLLNTFNSFIKTLQLEKRSEYSCDFIVVYVDNLEIIRGFFKKYITEDFPMYVDILDHIEFRSFKPWNEKLSNIYEIADTMQKIVEEVFIPNRYFYLTPNQKTRKLLDKACKKSGDTTAKDLFPKNAFEYWRIKKALFGGLCYCPYPNLVVPHPMISIDLRSAYIYSLLIEKHCAKNLGEVDAKNYQYYMNNPYETSLGLYKIKYSTFSNIVNCYKDTKGKNLESGEHEVCITMNDVDLDIFVHLPDVNIHSIECKYLQAFTKEQLPKYILDLIYEEYKKKSEIDKEKDPILYKMQKEVVNGIYGNTIKKLTAEMLNDLKSHAYLTPHFGIWTTSYTKSLLIGLASKLEGWYYSDTDSAYALDTPKNNALIEEFNAQIRAKVRDFCDQYNYEYEVLKDLGTFKVEYHIKKFKALKRKEYLFTTEVEEKNPITGEKVKKDKIVVKAAGCSKEEMPLTDDLYKMPQLPIGTRTFGFLQPEYRKVVKDGKEYESDGSYYEIKLKNEGARLMMMAISKIEEMCEDKM